jgi:trk system potassium uptake protein TrkA
MAKQVLIIGLDRFGTSIAEALSKMGHDVLAVDVEERKVQNISSQVTRAVQTDATDEAALKTLGVGNFDVAIVSMGASIQNSVLATILLKRLGVPVVVARAGDELHGSILEKIGADKVVYPERETGVRVAHEIALGDVLDYMPVHRNYGISKVAMPPHAAGQSISELGLGRTGKLGLAVLMILRGKEITITPDRTEIIKQDDVLIVAGSDDKLQHFLSETKSNRKP